MEEKIYFKPESGGKKKEKNRALTKLVTIVLVLGLIIAVIVWLLKGKTSTTAPQVKSNKNDFLVCKNESLAYEIFSLSEQASVEAKITFSVTSENIISGASLTYTVNYEDEVAANYSYNINVANFNDALTEAGLPVGSFSNKITRYENKLIATLTASQREITEKSAKFFMIDNGESLNFEKLSILDFKDIYESEGFVCETSLEK